MSFREETMLNAYERQLILFYLCNAASRFHYASPEARNLVDWVFENYDLLTLEGESKELSEHLTITYNEVEMSAREWQRLRKTLENEYSAACKGTREDSTARRLRQLGQEMGLAPEDVAVLEIMLRNHMQPIIESLIDSAFECGRRYHRRRFFSVTSYLLPYVLGVPANSFHTRFTFKIALDYLTPQPVASGVPHLFRARTSARSRRPHHPDPRRFRRSPPKSRNPRPPARREGTRRIAARRVRGQAESFAQDGLLIVNGEHEG